MQGALILGQDFEQDMVLSQQQTLILAWSEQ
jgi:hypothetical protein